MMQPNSMVVSPIIFPTPSPSGDNLASLPPAADPTSVAGFARELRPLLPAEAFEPDRTLLPLSAINGAILLLGWLMADRLDQWPPLWLPLWLPFALIMGNSVFVLGLSMHDLLHGSVVRGPLRRRLVALLGFSMSWMTPTLWQAVHNRAHHQHTNGLSDPDRAFLEAQPRNWGKRLFQLIAPSLEVSPLGLALGMSSAWALHHFRTTCSVLLFNTGATRFAPAPIRVSGRERRRIALELLAVIGLHAAVVIWLDAQPLKLLLGYFLPLWCAYAMAMAYIYTNHMLSPLREDNDPLLTSVSLNCLRFWIACTGISPTTANTTSSPVSTAIICPWCGSCFSIVALGRQDDYQRCWCVRWWSSGGQQLPRDCRHGPQSTCQTPP